MLSGVGPKEHLIKHGIPLVHDLPGVGQKLQDHATVGALIPVKPGHSLSHISATKGWRSLQGLAEYFKWRAFGSGALTSNVLIFIFSLLKFLAILTFLFVSQTDR